MKNIKLRDIKDIIDKVNTTHIEILINANESDQWKVYFQGCREIIQKKEIITSNISEFKINRLPVVARLYHGAKLKQTTSPMICQTIYEKIIENWRVQLVLEKTTAGPCKIVTWDDNDKIYIKVTSVKSPDKFVRFSERDLNSLMPILNQLAPKIGGTIDSTKLRIIEIANKCINPQRLFQRLSHIFNKTRLLNRADYFGVVGSLTVSDKTAPNPLIKYCVNNMCAGLEYLITIDAEKSRVYYNTKSYVKEMDTNIESGPVIISAVKYDDPANTKLQLKTHSNAQNYIIRRVIVDNGNLIKYTSATHINELNEKYGKLLGLQYAIYTELTAANYKKCMDTYYANIPHAKHTKSDSPYYIELAQLNYNILDPIYKWTPYTLPITFYCRRCPDPFIISTIETYGASLSAHVKTPNETPKILYILFLTIDFKDLKSAGLCKLPFHDELFGADGQLSNIDGEYHHPIHFSPSTFPTAFLYFSDIDLDKQYARLTFDYSEKKWIFMEKTNSANADRYGDDFKTVELNTWNSYRNPLVYQDLVIDKSAINAQMYFVNYKSKLHEAPIKLNNFCKISLINSALKNSQENQTQKYHNYQYHGQRPHNQQQFKNSQKPPRTHQQKINVIDLASGRASDLMTYRYTNPEELLFCEIDKDAIEEALQRKYNFENPNNTGLKIFNTDLNLPFKKNIAEIQKTYSTGTFTNAFCFFALHYLTDTPARIKNIAGLISGILDKNGEFIYTAFDGPTLINLLAENGGKWEVFEKGEKKYSIIARYKPADIKTASRPIKLILPFNANTYYYDENLINDVLLDNTFKKYNLEVIKEGSFTEFLHSFKNKKPAFYDMLTPSDKIFIGLYKYKIYKKL